MRFGKPDDGRRRERTPSPKKPPRPGATRERVLILVLTLVLMLLYFSVQRLADDGTLPRALGKVVVHLLAVQAVEELPRRVPEVEKGRSVVPGQAAPLYLQRSHVHSP